MSNGTIAIQGLQTGLPNGSQAIGPFSIPCSSAGYTTLVQQAETNYVVDVNPVGGVYPVGVMFVANPAISGATYSVGFISNELTRISPSGGYPCIWMFDPAAIPSLMYVTVSNTNDAYLALTFF